MDAELVEAVRALTEYLFTRLGPDRTLLLIFGLFVLLAINRIYTDWRADREANRALEAKEAALQRVASQERAWRVYFLVQGGMSEAQARRIIEENEYVSTPKAAREGLEKKRKKIPIPRKGTSGE